VAVLQQKIRQIEGSQQKIYSYLMRIVRRWQPEKVLMAFGDLFINYECAGDKGVWQALGEVIDAGNEQEFIYTLQRSCFILINFWNVTSNYFYGQRLVALLSDTAVYQHTNLPKLITLRRWVQHFVVSSNYRKLKTLATRHIAVRARWCDRYSAYLLTSQYANVNNPSEQRQIAGMLSHSIKNQFKYDLAMYTARINRPLQPYTSPSNPTNLGDEVLSLIRLVLGSRRGFNYRNLANIFMRCNTYVTYAEFKSNFETYLRFSYDDREALAAYGRVINILYNSYPSFDDDQVDQILIRRTCDRVIKAMILGEDSTTPSELIKLVLQHGHPLALVIPLLKIVLLSPASRVHLETCLAELIKHYSQFAEEECKPLIDFLEILRVTLAIYTEDTDYNLLKMSGSNGNCSHGHNDHPTTSSLPDYRIFSQSRSPQRA
jgi:hypothetical protein